MTSPEKVLETQKMAFENVADTKNTTKGGVTKLVNGHCYLGFDCPFVEDE